MTTAVGMVIAFGIVLVLLIIKGLIRHRQDRTENRNLVAELQATPDTAVGALVVETEHETEAGFNYEFNFVWANDPGALERLNRYDWERGIPVAILTAERARQSPGDPESRGGAEVTFSLRMLPGWEDYESLQQRMNAVMAQIRANAHAFLRCETSPITVEE